MEENEELTKPFTMSELEVVVKGLRGGATPGPDGYSAIFFKVFWNDPKTPLLDMLQDLRNGSLDLKIHD
jgi:hypothetical protein